MKLRKTQYAEGGTYTHLELGNFHVIVKKQARSIRARWIGPELRVTVPEGLRKPELDRFVDMYGKRLLALRPCVFYNYGTVIETPEIDITVCHAPDDRNGNLFMTSVQRTPLRAKLKNYYIQIPKSVDDEKIGTDEIQKAVNTLVRRAARDATSRFVIPRANVLAAELGVAPKEWKVDDARSRLGCCSSRGVITLSSRLIFLPGELRDFVVCHELAHLSEMNHSARFHALCNEYCGGREKELNAKLKGFRFPVF